MNLLIEIVKILVFCVVYTLVHELGHYVVAKRLGAINLRIEFWKWKGIPIGLQVPGKFPCDFKTMKPEDYLLVFRKMVRVLYSGTLFGMMPLIFFWIIDWLSQTTFLIIALFTWLWVIYELETGFGEGKRK